ncbi:uncharacterized protein LOC144542988 [Centroberyx gerrardi]
MSRRRRIRPADDAKTHILSGTDKPGLLARHINSDKGRGVFATNPIEPGDFVLEYRGKLLTQEECQSRCYSDIESTFLFDFEWQNCHFCLDASEEDESLGRLVNDSHKNPNCVMKKIIVNNKPHLCLFAMKKIEIGSEIEYNYGDSKWPWRSKVADPQTPAAAVETETCPVTQMFHEESKPDETNTQVADPQTPAAAVETETCPVTQMFHEESKPDETNTQVADPQTPAAAVETETCPVTQMFHEESKPDETNTQVVDPQTPAAAVETETCPVTQMFHEESKPDETNTQVVDPQTPAAAVETETCPVTQMFHEESKPDETNTQVFQAQRFSLVAYSDSDETDEDCMENKTSTPHRDGRKKTDDILMDSGPDVSDHLYDTDESIVEDTCDKASPNHSNEQSDDELVPPLRRTKSILMDRVYDFAGCLYDSSDDSTQGTFISEPKRNSQRPRRISCHPRPLAWRGLQKRTSKVKRGRTMTSAFHPYTNVPPHHKSKTRQGLQQMSVNQMRSACQEKRSQKMRSACHPLKNVPPHHKSINRVCLQKKEVKKLL